MEFCLNEFDEFCSNDGMVRHHTIPYTPQQNGVAERMNMTIISRARCMLSNAKMHRSFWAEAASTACYLINRSPSVPLDKKTPIEVWSGSPADYSDLRVFGCTAYAHVDNGKLEPRAVKCIFLGYGSGVKAYRLWNPETKKIVLSRNVVFNEAVMFNDSPSTDISDAIDSPDVSDDDETEEYMIVGSQEADPFASKISNESPIAQALFDHKVGDVVTVDSPNGSYEVEIINIK